MKRTSHILAGVTVVALAFGAQAATRYTISAEEVASAMTSNGISVAPAQVTLLSAVVASTPSPRLRVRSVERWSGDRAMVRMECDTAAECLPFFASVRLGSSSPAPRVASTASSAISSEPRVQPESKYAVRVGTPATLLLDGDHVHIRIAVTCLSNGAAGQTVRAETPDHEKTFTAQVAGDGVLRGRL